MDNIKKNKSRTIIIILCAVIALLMVITVVVLIEKNKGIQIDPDYAAGEIDNKAKNLNKKEEKNKTQAGGGSVSLDFAPTATVKGKKISMNFSNPSRSTKDVVLQLIIEKNGKELIIAQSNRLPAGYQLKEMELDKSIKLSNGIYEGKYTVLYYDSESNERSSLSTDLPITITVK